MAADGTELGDEGLKRKADGLGEAADHIGQLLLAVVLVHTRDYLPIYMERRRDESGAGKSQKKREVAYPLICRGNP